jgi:Fe-S-cluster containining protein
MGYPAFILPRAPMTESEIEADPELRQTSAKRKQELMAGHPGEPLWHQLPADLKQELETHMKQYRRPDYDGTLESFDGPCIWLDMETRMCKHHTHRPDVCRDFETGSKACLDWRKVYQDRIL